MKCAPRSLKLVEDFPFHWWPRPNQISLGLLICRWGDDRGLGARVCVCVFVLRILYSETWAQGLSCCYGNSTVTLTQCEITHCSGSPPSKSHKHSAFSADGKFIYLLNAIWGQWWWCNCTLTPTGKIFWETFLLIPPNTHSSFFFIPSLMSLSS